MMSQPGLQTIAIHLSTKISQSKGNQTMKFRQVTEYNNRNIFLQKLCQGVNQKITIRTVRPQLGKQAQQAYAL